MKHKHYDLIVAWANDPSINLQCRVSGFDCSWSDLGKGKPISWLSEMEYRIKPKSIWFRPYLILDTAGKYQIRAVSTVSEEKSQLEENRETLLTFVKWVDGWQETSI